MERTYFVKNLHSYNLVDIFITRKNIYILRYLLGIFSKSSCKALFLVCIYSYYPVLIGPQDNYLQSVTKTTEIISNLQKGLTLTHNHGDWGLIIIF